MEQRFEKRFAALASRGEGAFMPFVTLCDPDYDSSLAILRALIAGGADALELGFPFSDPCADGPVIQHADKRALGSGARTADFFRLISEIRASDAALPMSILVYANVVLARGIDNFFASAEKAGLDAVLIPDIPVNMLTTCENFLECARRHHVATVLIAPPNASDAALDEIIRLTSGYTYVLSRYGITGTENTFGQPVRIIRRILERHGAAPVLGFGISTPDHVRQALKIGARGAIAGSACVKIIEKNLGDLPRTLEELQGYVSSMKAATL